MSNKRWKAVIEFKAGANTPREIHTIDELEELQDIVEKGPDFRLLKKITVTYEF